KIRFRVNGQVVRVFDIELAKGEPDFWVFSDVSSFKGEKLVIEVDSPDVDLIVTQGDAIEGEEGLYREKHRPQFHFTSRRGWHNDPNGLVYYQGVYHLFYQHNPYGWRWGNMHWGHAVSKNLVRWQEVGDVLYPDDMGAMFSGSAVVDWDNTAGLKRGDNDTLVCFYTAAGEFAEPAVPYTQCMAFSNDGGQTWQKYAENPVLPHVAAANRDPKVIWHKDSEQWIMALYLTKSCEEQQRFALYTSQNLKQWDHLQDVYFPGSGECPDFFPLPLDGDPENIKWVFWVADGHHLIGTFDGTTFAPETPFLQNTYCGDKGPGTAYAAQTWSDILPKDGRRIQIAWLFGDLPGMPFNQQMTFPVELTLNTTDDRPQLHFWPVKEIENLYQKQQTLGNIELAQDPFVLPTGDHDLLDIHATIDVGDASEIELNLRGIRLSYHAAQQKLFWGDRSVPLEPIKGEIHLRVLLDRASVEVFAADGLVYLPLGVIPDDDNRTCFLQAKGGTCSVNTMNIRTLRSSWE
ncbi:MAG: glycoside hydrolase family 32 protein, partial [Gammaproteobacteria bacterium]